MREVLQGKIHDATVTAAELEYVGSITLDMDLADKAGFWIGQKVLVVSNTSGARLWTYVIEGARGSGTVCMNGAAAHLIKKGERIIVMGFELSDGPVAPKLVLVDKDNRFARYM